MARLMSMLLVLAAVVFLCSCGGGNPVVPGGNNPGDRSGDQGTGQQPADDGSDLQILFVTGTPQTGPSPLKVDFLAVVKGGVAPYRFSWDFTNDGAPDVIENRVKVTTGTAVFFYPFLESDRAKGLNQSTFNAVLTVTDSRVDSANRPNFATRTSDPATVVVTNGSAFQFDPLKTGILNPDMGSESLDFSNGAELMTLDFYVFKDNADIRFSANAVDGSAPYSYRWNFDYATVLPDAAGQFHASEFDSRIDTTTATPHYVFSYNHRTQMDSLAMAPGETVEDYTRRKQANYRLISLEAVDTQGNKTSKFIGVKVVPETYTPPPPPETFKVIVSTDPPVTLDSDPAAFSLKDVPVQVLLDKNNVDLNGQVIIPKVFFSAAVSTVPGEAGEPPYVYSWDFEGDGYIDTQVVSPTVPFWDPGNKNIFNPYGWPGDYVCKLRVRDAVGRTVLVNIPVRSVDVTGQNPTNPLEVVPNATVTDAGGASTLIDHGTKGDTVSFNVNVTGGTPPYHIIWDRDYNGFFGNPADGNEIIVPDTKDPLLTVFDAGVLDDGFYLAGVRVTDESTTPIQVVKYMPTSISEDIAAPISTNNDLLERASMGVATIGGNIYVVGGFLGNVALQAVDRVSWGDQSYAIDSSQLPGATLTDMPTPRGALAMGSIQNHLIAVGGISNIDGHTGRVETMYIDTNGDGVWINRPAIGYRSGTSKELAYMGMAPATLKVDFGNGPVDAPGFIVCGGNVEGGSVSGTTWYYLPHEGYPTYAGNVNPNNDYWFLMRDMPTPRYDFAAVTLGNFVYTIGGITADGTVSSTVEALNLNTLVWITLPSLPEPRAGAVALAHDTQNFLSVIGGYSAVNSNGDYELSTDTYLFSPASTAWSGFRSLTLPRAHLGGAVINHTFFTICGEKADQTELDTFGEVRVAPVP